MKIVWFFIPFLALSASVGIANFDLVAANQLLGTNKPNDLSHDLNNYLKLATSHFHVSCNTVRALIVPHAGYDHSGLCAACAYQTLCTSDKKNEHIKRVIILAPNHFDKFWGVALPSFVGYKTSLGPVEFDTKAITKIKRRYKLQKPDLTSPSEHSIEMQLPFLQKTIKEFKLVPLFVGALDSATARTFANALKTIIDSSTLLVISSDFTHYGKQFGYTPFTKDLFHSIQTLDSQALNIIVNSSPIQLNSFFETTRAHICGLNALLILLFLLQDKAFGDVTSHLCCYYKSPQMENVRNESLIDVPKLLYTVKDHQMITSVSYAACVFADAPKEKHKTLFTEYEKKALLLMARSILENDFAEKDVKVEDRLLYPPLSLAVQAPRRVAVSIKTKKETIRGISATSDQPLYKAIIELLHAIIGEGKSSKQIKKEELGSLVVDISVFEKPITIRNYKDIILEKHGIILKHKLNKKDVSALFLPNVACEFGGDHTRTLEMLSKKAGLSKDSWKSSSLEVFETINFHE